MSRFRSDTAVALAWLGLQIIGFVTAMAAIAFAAAAVLTLAGIPR